MDEENNHKASTSPQSNNLRFQNWTTVEELILASAVRRHGLNDWDAVAAELQTRLTDPNLTVTALDCRHRFRDLRRRFGGGDGDGEGDGDPVPWLDQLRKVRLAELYADVERSDGIIL